MISIKSARKAGVPLVAIKTFDMQQTINNIVSELNGKSKEIPIFRWDCCRGLIGLNETAKKFCNSNEINVDNSMSPVDVLVILETKNIPERSIIFFENAHLYWKLEQVLQATWNLRDTLKVIGATLVMLCSTTHLPAELKNDVITLTDSLPDDKEIDGIISSITKDAGINKLEDKDKVKDTLLGLSAFAVEQVLSMAIEQKGDTRSINTVDLWERKRKMIEQTDGLSVWRGDEKFSDIGGYENVKKFMKGVCTGEQPPRCIVFIDEIEKALAGSQSDSSGVSQDYLRTLLTWMQDEKAVGGIFIGVAGSGKSAIAKATGNEANIPTVNFDLGGMKGSLVGESEMKIRNALDVIKAISQGRALFIATCNSIGSLPPELRRRFSLGTFFFAEPDDSTKTKIWSIKLKKFNIPERLKKVFPNDSGWTGAEIENCCNISYRLNIPLTEAADYIVPVTVSGKDRILQMKRDASGKYIDASKKGVYIFDETKTVNSSRKFGEG